MTLNPVFFFFVEKLILNTVGLVHLHVRKTIFWSLNFGAILNLVIFSAFLIENPEYSLGTNFFEKIINFYWKITSTS